MSGKVLIAAPVHPVMTEGLEARGYTYVIKEKIGQQEAAEVLKGCVGLVTSTRLQVNKTLIDAAPNLKWIGRMGSGMEVIDVVYAESKGISCYSSPEGNRNAVAEHALGMLLSLNKRILKSAEEVKQGFWKRTENRGVELEGKTVGIIGFGNTGSQFAKKLRGFSVDILSYDKCKCDYAPSYVKECNSLEKIYEEADIISFHVPWGEDTNSYFNEVFINSMKKPFILINTSRGKVVDTDALLEGLKKGKVSAACLDVWEVEPISAMSENSKKTLFEMVEMPQVIVTPHIAGYSEEALYKMSKILLDKIVNRK